MDAWFLGPLRRVVGVLLANESSGQIAAGAAIGVVLGLTPKATLLAVVIGVLLAAIRVNRAAGLFVAGLVSLAAPLCDGFSHRLGLLVLSAPSMQDGYAWLYEKPVVPWFGLQNTVVCGSFLLGLYLSYPTYVAAKWTVDAIRPKAVAWITRYRLARVLLGVDLTSRLSAAS